MSRYTDDLALSVTEDMMEEDLVTGDVAIEDEEQGMFEHFRFEVDKGQAPLRIDKYMACHMEDTSRHRVQCAIKEGYVQVGDKTVKANYIVRPGDVIRFVMPYRRRGVEILPQNIPLDIVYEDDDVLVVNKKAGMVVHPGHGHFEGTLVNALSYHLGISQGPDGADERMGILVHRIDKDTSGLLVVAKTPDAKTSLGKQFFNKTTHRAYNALVWGNLSDDTGRIEGNITRDPKDRLRMKVVAPDSGIGKPAVTHWRVLERFGYTTLVECVLETGRTHQIRAHMKAIGHPLFGDERYGGTEILWGQRSSTYKAFVRNCLAVCPRQALHAKTLGFVHPRTGQQMDFDSQWPADFAALIDKWRQYINGKSNI